MPLVRPFVLTLIAGVPFAAGCYTTRDARDRARLLAGDVSEYRKQQSDRIDQLNRQYREGFARHMDDLRAMSALHLAQGRDIDAQSIADDLTADLPRASLEGRFRQVFGEAVQRQRSRIDQVDASLAGARDTYQAAYKDAKIDVSRLDRVETNLLRLSEEDDQFEVAVDLIQRSAKIYEEMRKKAEEEKKQKQASTPPAPPAGPTP